MDFVAVNLGIPIVRAQQIAGGDLCYWEHLLLLRVNESRNRSLCSFVALNSGWPYKLSCNALVSPVTIKTPMVCEYQGT